MTSLLFLSLLAHDLYLMPSSFHLSQPGHVSIAFHNGDSFPTPDRPPPLARVIPSSSLSLQNLRVDDSVLRAEVNLTTPGYSIAAASTRPNGIELAPPSFEKYLQHEGLNHVLNYRAAHKEANEPGRERYSKYVKTLLRLGDATGGFDRLVGFPIEIIPLVDPASLHPGQPLPLRVIFRGQPAPDLQIEAAWLTADGKATRKIAGRTGPDGHLNVLLPAAGTYKFHTVLMERCQDTAAADWESFWSSLTLEIK